MDLILINSPDYFGEPVHYEDEPRIPLGLMSIAAWVQANGFTAKIYDCYAKKYSISDICDALSEDQPRVVGVNCYSTNWQVVFTLCNRLKEQFPQMVLVLGGPHPSCNGAHIFENCQSVDYIVAGQGEQPVLELLQAPEKKEKLAVSREDFRRGRKIEPVGLQMPMTQLPMPAYELIDMEKYIACEDQAYVASSRGCFYNCAFCCSKNVFNGCASFRSCQQVLTDIDHLHKAYGVTKFYFYDDNILRWDELGEFGKAMQKRGFTWTAQASARDFSAETVEKLKGSGCTRLSIGFESGSKKLQKYIGKTIPEDIYGKLRLLGEENIAIRGYFMVGFPDETPEDVMDTARVICKLKHAGMKDLCVFATRPYCGTRLYEDCKKRFGEEGLEDFQYLSDYLQEDDPFVRGKLKAYNTVATKAICPAISPKNIRSFIRGLYHIFLQAPESDSDIRRLLYQFIEE